MALGTGYIFMTAIELKSGIVMINPGRFPLLKIMTPGTGTIIFCIKLFVMDIIMAIETTVVECGKLLNRGSVGTGLKMALPAGYNGMLSGKLEICGIMIKIHFRPNIR